MAAPPQSAVLRAQPLAVLGQVARAEGVPALYVGVLPALIAMAPSGAVYYSLYDALKTRHLSAVARRTGAFLTSKPGFAGEMCADTMSSIHPVLQGTPTSNPLCCVVPL